MKIPQEKDPLLWGDGLLPIATLPSTQSGMRSLAFYLLYALDRAGYEEEISEVCQNLALAELPSSITAPAFAIAEGVRKDRKMFDELMTPFIENWSIERISCCTKIILYIALWELRQREVPPAVVIDEAVKLTKEFAEEDSYRFVNGVLDSFCKAYGYPLPKEE